MSHGTDLSHQNPWDTHGNALSHYSLLFHRTSHGTILSQVIKEYAPVVSNHQSKSLMITKSLAGSDNGPMSNTFHTISGGTILSQVIEEYAPVTPPHPSKSLSFTKSLASYYYSSLASKIL